MCFEAFLKNRRQRVFLGETVSSWVVPQWSVIGPLLFVIYINDRPSHLMNVSKLYNNNTKLLSEMVTEESAIKRFRHMIGLDLDTLRMIGT